MSQCRITFFDTVNRIHRTFQVNLALPLVAAEGLLEWLKKNHIPGEELDKSVKVEIIGTAECSLSTSRLFRLTVALGLSLTAGKISS